MSFFGGIVQRPVVMPVSPIGKEAPGKAGRLTFALIKGARLHAMVYTAMATKHSMVASVWAE